MNNTRFAFFGSSSFSVIILDELKKAGFIPAIIITTPDKPKGRKLILTPTPVKIWAKENNIVVFDPQKLNAEFTETLRSQNCELFIVASYGKIIPKAIVEMPKYKTLNVHPSLLPRYRGASPLQSVILADDKKTGVTIMVTDADMDHGPIVATKKINIDEWPDYQTFEDNMAHEGGALLASILSDWIEGKIIPTEQNHNDATFTKKVSKEDGLVNLDDSPRENFLKIQAYNVWPQAYFFLKKNDKDIRIKITKASYDSTNNKLIIEKVIPEGGKEMSYEDFKRGYETI
jgi:methionyl-tRNA formyltransferase